MGGYGIVGGNLPLAAGFALASDYLGLDEVDAVPVRRRRLQPGHVRRDDEPRRAVEAAGRLHGHEQPVRHGHVARAPLGRDRPHAQGRGLRRARHALRRHGRAWTPTTSRPRRCGSRARSAGRCSSRPSRTASAATRWPTPRSTARRSRSTSGASATRSRSSATSSSRRASSTPTSASGWTRETIERVDASVAFADASPHPSPNDLYDDIYVLGDQVRGWYSVDERTPTPHRGEDERGMDRADLPRSAEHGARGHARRRTPAPKPADAAQRDED